MGILTRNNEDQQQQQGNQPQAQKGELVRRQDPSQVALRDPFQLMREFISDPFGVMQTLPWLGIGREQVWTPSFEVRETDEAFVFKGDLPGVKNEDLDITLTGNRLEVSGKRESENELDEGRWHTYERSYGNFRRTFALPESADLDKVRCELKDGVLSMVVPRRPGSSQKARRIQIGSGSKS